MTQMSQTITTEKYENADERDPQTFAIIGAAIEVHKILGPGFLEAVYQEALEREFVLRKIPYRREAELSILYKGEPLTCFYKADFICYQSIIVELKALRTLSTIETSQVLNYLKASRYIRGLLFNFGSPRLQHQRIVN